VNAEAVRADTHIEVQINMQWTNIHNRNIGFTFGKKARTFSTADRHAFPGAPITVARGHNKEQV
jgi:hypothetical protein